jgi:hypothetical protein
MSDRADARARQRCRTLVLAAALGVVLVTFSLVDRSWPGVVVGAAGTVVVVVLYRRECMRDASGTDVRES